MLTNLEYAPPYKTMLTPFYIKTLQSKIKKMAKINEYMQISTQTEEP